MKALVDQTIFPFPCELLWPTVPLRAYCVFQYDGMTVKGLKVSATEAKCLNSGRSIRISNVTEQPVVWLHFPQWHVRTHEAGHLVFALYLKPSVYHEGGILLNAWDGSGMEIGNWVERKPEYEIQLSLAGILTQLELAPYSFHPVILPVLQKSVIVEKSHPVRLKVPTAAIPSEGWAQTDFQFATLAGVRLCGDKDTAELTKALREQEQIANPKISQ